MELDKAKKVEIIKKMSKDSYLYFIENFLKMLQFDDIQSSTAIPIKLFPYQIEFLKEMDNAYKNRHDLGVKKSRKAGFSWVSVAYVYWRWLFDKDFYALIGSHKEDTLDKKGNPDTLMGKLDIFIQYTPTWLLPKGFNYSKHRLEFNLKNPESGNLIKGETSISDFARSGRYGMVLMDEVAFWSNIELSLKASASASKCRIMGSSYNGFNEFHEVVNHPDMQTFEMNWEKNPIYNIDMYFDEEQNRWTSPEIEKEKKRYLVTGEGLKAFLEEIYMEPVKEGSSVFNVAKLPLQENSVVHPTKEDLYSIGVDVAAGQGYNVDKQAIVVESKLTGETVDFWEGNINVEDLAWKIIKLANKYNKALVVVESNRGTALLEILFKYYKKIYRKECQDSVTKKLAFKMGYNMNGKTKEPAVMGLQSEIELGRKKVCHGQIIEQLTHYADLGNGKYGSPSKKIHDDRVIAYMLSNIGIQSRQLGVVKSNESIFFDEFKKKRKVLTYTSDSCAY